MAEEFGDKINKITAELPEARRDVDKVRTSGPTGMTTGGPPAITTVRKKNPENFQPGAIAGREARWTTWAFVFGGYFSDVAPKGEEFLNWCSNQPMEITEGTLTTTEVPVEFRAEAKDLSKVLYKEL